MPAKATTQREKKLKGNSTKRSETKDFVKIDPQEPDMPGWLNDTAQAEWRRLVPLLAKAKILTPLDGMALGMLCAAHATIEECLKVIQKQGSTFRSPNGHICQRPEVKIIETTYKQYLKLCAEFGMTPKARSAMRVHTGGGGSGAAETAKTQKERDFEKFFGQDRSTLAR